MILVGQVNIEKAPAGAWTGKLATGETGGADAKIDQQVVPKASDGAKLQPSIEEKLKWGEPVNGLRAAIIFRTSSDKPKAGDLPDLYLAVQNVSKAPIRLSDANVPPDVRLRNLLHKKDGRILYILGARVPALGDVMLQPREVTFLPMFDADTKFKGTGDPTVDGHTVGQNIAEGVLKNTNETLVAEIEIEKAPAGAWTGKLVTGDSSGAAAAGQPTPKGKEAQSLFKVWQNGARLDGKIPGGTIATLTRTIARFIKLNPTHAGVPKLAELLKRIDVAHDWTQADAITLLDDVSAIYASLPSWVHDEPRFSLGGAIQTGQPLPMEMENARWGEPQPNGLRVAWFLEPNAGQHRLGMPLKSRILFHNAGKNSVVFRTLTFNQSGEHKAIDAKGANINITSTYWLTLARVVACRLAPGEFTEMTAPGIGVGTHKEDEDWRGTRVGSWIDAKEGDVVTFTPAPVVLNGRHDGGRTDSDQDWWLDFIKDRLSLDAPLPADAGERKHLLDRAVRDLFGSKPTPEETAAFVADRTADAFDLLALRLVQRAGTSSFTGNLQSGPTKFRVLPVDPEAAKRPRSANNPGHYTLGGTIGLVVSRRPDGERIVNEASIEFYSQDQTKPTKPHAIKLPDGYNTWAAAWVRGGTVLWVQQQGNLRSYDFTNPAEVKETTIQEPANLDRVPKPILEALRGVLDVTRVPKPAPAATKE